MPYTARTHVLRVGTLRGRAIDAALKKVETRGAENVSLRDLAADLSTGPASLYYHFANKDALLAELASEGFRQLRRDFAEALSNSCEHGALHACGDAYLRFARRRPQLYRLMYAERILAAHPQVKEAEAEAFATFARGISGGEASNETLEDRAKALWAFGRGIAALTLADAESGGIQAAKVLSHQIVRGLESLMGEPIRHRLPPHRVEARRS